MTWFEILTGFKEESPEQVRKNLIVEGNRLKSMVNGKSYICGTLTTPSLAELRQQVAAVASSAGRLTMLSIVGNVQHMHKDPANANAMFQVASQFNLLEMVGPQVTPERGVGIYENDRTQGPACAISAGAGTIYRNYFVPVNGKIGQTADNQLDCLADLGAALGNKNNRLWKMQNGYALPTQTALAEINDRLQTANEAERDRLRGLLRIGVHAQIEVTLDNAGHRVSQAYCSALPVAYSGISSQRWESFARLVLEAAYEATFCAAVSNAQQTGCRRLFLTALGGGAFGNDKQWILDAIKRAATLYRAHDLEVYIVSYGSADPAFLSLIDDFNQSQQH
ncbi:MAG: hypothetical protein CVV42_12590 [Candidatus Riflebacteria bacterium HGW-Riflebacteria-2]|jgi:hypothetical protein|nr:MAG: hypothetical protein CVV42_12590 [Candidatus Riflebacteria bacterium HGW-Riflebacteria-2]